MSFKPKLTAKTFDAAMAVPGQTFQGLVNQIGTETTHLLRFVQTERPDALPAILEMQRQDASPQNELMLRRLASMRRAANRCALDPAAMMVKNMGALMAAYARYEVGSTKFPPGWVAALQHVLIERGCPAPSTASVRTLRLRLIELAKIDDNRWDIPEDQLHWIASHS